MCVFGSQNIPTPEPVAPPKQPPRRVDQNILDARAGTKKATRKRLGLRGTFKQSTFGTANLATSNQTGTTSFAPSFKES